MLRSLAIGIVYSNIWVAIGAALLAAQTYRLHHEEINWGLVGFVFCATVATYNLQRILRFNKWWMRATEQRLHWIVKSRKALRVTTGIALVGAGILALSSLKSAHILALIPMAAIAILYAWPVIPSGDKPKALRDVPGLKILWISASWVAVTVVLPLIDRGNFDTASLWMMLGRFLFIFAITIPFDIRDMHYDSPAQKTIPQLVGLRDASWIALALNAAFIATTLINYSTSGFSQSATLAMVAAGLVNMVVLAFGFRPRHELYYTFGLDGLTVLQPVLLLLITG